MTHWTPADLPDLNGKTAIVTGANSGLGLVTTREFARKGALVIMACRNPGKANAAAEQVRSAVPAARLQVEALDLADLRSVSGFAQRVAATQPRIDILCNNAGVMALPLRRTAQGMEMQIGTNHFGHFALTGQLLPLLEAAGSARIVNTASLAHTWTRGMDFGDLNWEHRRYRKWDAYGKSKLANLLFTFELARRLRASGSTVAALAAHPGYASTHLQAAGPEMAGSQLSLAVMNLGNRLLAQSADQGAEPILYAAAMPTAQSGEYYGPDGFRQLRGHPRRVRARKAAYDTEASAQLWELSESLTDVPFLSSTV